MCMDAVSSREGNGRRNHGKLNIPSESRQSQSIQQKIMKGRKRAREVVSQKVSRKRISKRKAWPMALTAMDKSCKTNAMTQHSGTSEGHWDVETASTDGSF